MGITNVGSHFSHFEPPDDTWRPFVANRHSENPLSGNIPGRIQSLIFSRVFENIDGVYLFPAVGKDRAYLHTRIFISIAPHQDSGRDPASLRRIHFNAKVQEITPFRIELALNQMMVPASEERILLCKGLQSLITPAEIIQLVRRFEISKIVLFSSACSGLKRKPDAVPYPSRRLSDILGRYFENVTDQYFDSSELAELDLVHRMLFENYAWKSGHFPATKVEVFSQ